MKLDLFKTFEDDKQEIFDLLDTYTIQKFRTGSVEILGLPITELKTDEDWVFCLNLQSFKELEEIIKDGKAYLSNEIISCNTKEKYDVDTFKTYIFRYGLLNIICILDNNSSLYYSWAYSTYLAKKSNIKHLKNYRQYLFKYNDEIVERNNNLTYTEKKYVLDNLKLTTKDLKDYFYFTTLGKFPSHILENY